ncbi:MAG: endonuclease MutS2 [Clostridiales bacterium]|nr:endonuclease MutS2 [Clostridiales bacterium]
MDQRTLKVLEYHKIIDMLVDKCLSPLGKEMARALRPSSSIMDIRLMQEETKEAEAIIAQSERAIMDTFSDVSNHIRRARVGAMLSPGEILDIGKLLKTSGRVRCAILEFEEILEILPNMVAEISINKWLSDEIDRCIEYDGSIKDRASTTLDRIRRRIRRAHDNIRDRLDNIIKSPKHQKHLQEGIVTIRNDRYVIPVRQESRGSIPGLIHDQSSSGATLFIEPMSVVEANNEIRELIIEENKEIERILQDLTDKITSVSEEILSNMSILTRLDFILAKGKLSLMQRAVCPEILDGDILDIKYGRHPLIPDDEVVPISVELGIDFNSLVITGPNTGGKTVTLKTIGLFVLMAQSGLHLPAGPGTKMGVFTSVYADIGDEQSIEQNLSTFSSHMVNIVKILDRAKPGDLTLFDELGAGTDPTEGAALAMSILSYLNMHDIKVVATTHYSELKTFAMTEENMENASMEFDIETLSPTFKLLIGMPGKSNAFEISQRLGLSDHFISEAKKYLTQEDIHFEDVMQSIERDRLLAEEVRQNIKKEQDEIKRLREELDRAKNELKGQKSDIIKRAKDEARKIIESSKEEADSIIRKLNSLSAKSFDRQSRREAEEARRGLKERLDSFYEDLGDKSGVSVSADILPKDLKLGDTIYIENLNQKGQVLSLPDEDGQLQVQVGIMKVSAHISNVRKAIDTEDDKPTRYKPSAKNISVKDRKVRTEIDLRGRSAEEAILEVEKFLDDSLLLGLGEVTIIHGKGTGVLRNRVQEHLRNHPHIKSFRLGKFGEGESGVTVVNLK